MSCSCADISNFKHKGCKNVSAEPLIRVSKSSQKTPDHFEDM